MNGRWLLQLDDEDEKNRETRERVQERLRQELVSAAPHEGVQAALAAASRARASFRRKLRRLLADAAVENEAVFLVRLEAFSQREGPEAEIAQKVCQEMVPRLRPAVLAGRLSRAIMSYGHNEWILRYLLHLLRYAVEYPCVELRGTLGPLRQLPFGALDQSLQRDIRETVALVEEATSVLKDLPLPAASALTATNLPLPAAAQETSGSETEKEKTNLWNWLKSKFES